MAAINIWNCCEKRAWIDVHEALEDFLGMLLYSTLLFNINNSIAASLRSEHHGCLHLKFDNQNKKHILSILANSTAGNTT